MGAVVSIIVESLFYAVLVVVSCLKALQTLCQQWFDVPMGDENRIYIVESDAFIRETFSSFLDRAGLGECCFPVAALPDGEISARRVIMLDDLAGQDALRVGKLADRILAMRESGDGDVFLSVGPYLLDMLQNVLMVEGGGEAVRLTEKEAHLLEILHAEKGDSISRDVLLEKVWEYADGVETHTLETHIYRLRQKIEDDPSAPRILMTDDSGGYFLKFE